MGASESRCCKEKSVKQSESYGTDYDNETTVTRTPAKPTVTAFFDPRSPSQDFIRTPVEIECSPICKKPLSRVQPMLNEQSQLRNRNLGSKVDLGNGEVTQETNVTYQITEEAYSETIPDPQLLSCSGTRTPIIHKFTNRSADKDSPKFTLLDPRSPSDGIPRTPIDFADDHVSSAEENVLPDENVNMRKMITPVKPRRSSMDSSDGKQESKTWIEGTPKINIDPRSPSVSIPRTPLAETEKNKSESHDKADNIAGNLNDPRSPTSDVSRTPLSVIFGGARNLRRSVLMTNALLASPLNRKLSQSNPECAIAEKDPTSEMAETAGDVVEVVDVLPDILCSVNMFDVSCSSSMVASIGSEVDCLALDYDESEVSCQDIDRIPTAEDNFENDEMIETDMERDEIQVDFNDGIIAEGPIEKEESLLPRSGSDEKPDAQVQGTLPNKLEDLMWDLLPGEQEEDMVQHVNDDVQVISIAEPQSPGDEIHQESNLYEVVMEEKGRDVLCTSQEMLDIQSTTEIQCSDETPADFCSGLDVPQLLQDNGTSTVEYKNSQLTESNLKVLQEIDHAEDDKLLLDAVEKFKDTFKGDLFQFVQETHTDERFERVLAENNCFSSEILELALDEPEILAHETEPMRILTEETEPVPRYDDVVMKSQISTTLADELNAENKTEEISVLAGIVIICSDDTANSSVANAPMEAGVDSLASTATRNMADSIMTETSINLCSDSFDAQEANLSITTKEKTSSPGPMQGSRRPSGKLRVPSAIPQRCKSMSVGSEQEFTTYSVSSGIKKTSNTAIAKSAHLKKKAKSSSVSDAHPAEEISRQDDNQWQKHRVSNKYSALCKSETKLTLPGRSPLAVLSNENNSPSSEFQKNKAVLKTYSKSTKLPRYQGTPPISVNRSLSLSTSGGTAKRTRSTDRSRIANRPSFNYGKEN